MNDKDNILEIRAAMANQQDLIDALEIAKERLERENAELKAHAAKLREVVNHYQRGLAPSDNAMDELIHRLTKTPAQCLAARDAEIKAQALEDEAQLWPDDLTECSHVKSSLIESANQLRQQAKVGE